MEVNATLRGYGEPGDEPLHVRLAVPSAGILSLDVSVPASARALPKLGFADAACGGTAPVVLERSASHLVLAAGSAGPQVFRLASQDPDVPLSEFKLSSGFSPDRASRTFSEKDGEDEEIIELEADPLIYSGPRGGRSLQSRLQDLCHAVETDDHGDSFSCATFLLPGRETAGEIRNDWGDDGDVYRFDLGGAGGTLWTLAIETTGSTETFGGLYDRSGVRLATDGGETGGANFRIVRALPPGAYYVRVEGRDGAQGPYGLTVEASSW